MIQPSFQAPVQDVPLLLAQTAVAMPRFTASARATDMSVSRSLAIEVMRAFLIVSRTDGAAIAASMEIRTSVIISSMIVNPTGRDFIGAPLGSPVLTVHC